MARAGTFKKGNPGKPKGAKNRSTVAAKEAFQRAFDKIGGWEKLAQWASDKKNPDNLKTFFTLYARLIPMEVAGDPSAPVSIHITREVIGAK